MKGELWMCQMPFSARKVMSSPEVSWGPLSDATASGNPYVEKVRRKAVMVADVVVFIIGTISGHFK